MDSQFYVTRRHTPFQFSVLLTHDKTYPELKLLKHPPRHQYIWGKKGKRKQDE